jgi:hypothetical protein
LFKKVNYQIRKNPTTNIQEEHLDKVRAYVV